MSFTGSFFRFPRGPELDFDRRTHRRVVQRTNRLTYVFHAARALEDIKPEEISEIVLEHLEDAQRMIYMTWGKLEFNRLANNSLADLDDEILSELMEILDAPDLSPAINLTLSSLDDDIQKELTELLGKRVISNIYRQLLLGVITELWVDYLTQMEALRVSIGLEAYAQRDPLVQYKSRASELFQDLQSNIRLGVISRMFTYQPRDASRFQTQKALEAESAPETISAEDRETTEVEQLDTSIEPALEKAVPSNEAGGKKRRRRRH